MAKDKWCVSVVDYTSRDHKTPTRVRGNRLFKTKTEAQRWIDKMMDKKAFKKAYPVKYNPNHSDYAPSIMR